MLLICFLSLPNCTHFYFLQIINLFVYTTFLRIFGSLKMKYYIYINKVEIHRDAYHNHQIPLLPYKATLKSVACLGVCQYCQFELAQSQDCRSNLYQRTRVKSVPEK